MKRPEKQERETSMTSQPEEEIDMMKCPRGCGRKFREEIVHKHAKICKKVFQNKRKVFEAAQQRVLEGESVPIRRTKASRKPAPKQEVKKKDWKMESEKFRAMMRDAKGTGT